MILETERLYLKSPHEVTAEAACTYHRLNRKYLKEFEPTKTDEFYTIQHQHDLLTTQANDWDERKGCRCYIAAKESPMEIIGTISLNNIVMGAFFSCFLGYQIDYRHRNRGYMTEATNRIVQFAFDDLHLHRVEGNIMPRNKPSIAVVKKCGFELEGISKKYLKINGVWEDHLHYVILNEKME